MSKTLSELVSAAMADATSTMKVASAEDAEQSEPVGDDFLGSILGIEEQPRTQAQPEAAATKVSALQEVLDTAAYATKLAEALDRVGPVVTKLASEGGNPEVVESGHNTPGAVPKAKSTAHTYIDARPPKDETIMGSPGGVETNMKDFGTPDWTKNKEASLRLLKAKVASAEQFERIGQTKIAADLYAEVEAGYKKLAEADPSPSQESNHVSKVPGNAEAIALTKAQARDKTTAEAREFMMESPKVDNAVAPHIKTTTGVKTSAAEILREKKAGVLDAQAELNRTMRESSAVQGGSAGVGGALIGGALGTRLALGSKFPSKEVTRKALLKGGIPGAVLGAGALGALGVAGARSERRVADRLREEGRKEKTSSLEETQALLERLEAHAQSKTASAEDIANIEVMINYANTHGLEALHEVLEQA